MSEISGKRGAVSDKPYSVLMASSYSGFYVMSAENLPFEEAKKEADRLNTEGKSTVLTCDVPRYFHTNHDGVYWKTNCLPTNFLRNLRQLTTEDKSAPK